MNTLHPKVKKAIAHAVRLSVQNAHDELGTSEEEMIEFAEIVAAAQSEVDAERCDRQRAIAGQPPVNGILGPAYAAACRDCAAAIREGEPDAS